MRDALAFILEVNQIKLPARLPIEIPDVGRATLAQWLCELEFNVGVEIGTQTGLYAETLCQANPNLKLTCVDPWTRYAGYTALPREDLEADYEIAQRRLEQYGVRLFRAYSLDAVRYFEDNSFDFVYIDGNHSFEWVVNDIIQWSNKVKKGGIVAGHDFIRRIRASHRYDVVAAVSGYTQAYQINPWFVLGNKARIEGTVRDDERSWMWVKP